MGTVDQRNAFEKCLGVCSVVRHGEGLQTAMLALNAFLILTSYLIAKVVREPLILSGGGGAEMKSYAAALQAVVLIVFLRAYAKLVDTLPRRRLINYVTLFFVGCLIAFYVLRLVGVNIGIAFYLWVGVFSLAVIAQFWSFANDIYTPEQGKRLFVVLGFGASAGGVFGPLIADALIGPFGVYQLLLVSAAILALSLLITNYVDSTAPGRLADASVDSSAEAGHEEKGARKNGAFKVVARSKYLLMIAFLILLTNWVNTTGEYILSRSVIEAAQSADLRGGLSEEDFIGSFYATFLTVVGAAGLFLQLLVVSRFIKYLGVRTALMALPLVALGSYGLTALFPVLAAVRIGKIGENSTDYSLNNTVKQILFLPTTREQKYKAKVAIDSFFVRAGDVLSALLVWVGVTYLSFGVREFAIANLGLVAIWLTLAFAVGRANQRLVGMRAQDASETRAREGADRGGTSAGDLEGTAAAG